MLLFRHKENISGAAVLAWWVSAHIARPSLVPTTRSQQLTIHCNSRPGVSNTLFWLPRAPTHVTRIKNKVTVFKKKKKESLTEIKTRSLAKF